MIIRLAHRLPLLGRGRHLRRLTQTFTARHGIAMGLQREGLDRWTLTYAESRNRRVRIICDAGTARSLLHHLMSTTEPGKAPPSSDVVDAFMSISGATLDADPTSHNHTGGTSPKPRMPERPSAPPPSRPEHVVAIQPAEPERDTAHHRAAELLPGPALDHASAAPTQREPVVPDVPAPPSGEARSAPQQAREVGEPDAAADGAPTEPQTSAQVERSGGAALVSHDHLHWTSRPYGRLVDTELGSLVAGEQLRVDQLAGERVAADQRAEQLRVDVETGEGAAVATAEANLNRLLGQAAAVHTVQQLQSDWRAIVERAQAAAHQRASAEYDIARLGRFARTRRAELAERIDGLRGVEEGAYAAATKVARQYTAVQQQAGPPEQHDRIVVAARTAATDHPRALEEAYRRDREAAEAAYRHADRLAEQEQMHREHLAAAQTEQHLRERMPPGTLQVENAERATLAAAAEAAEREQLDATQLTDRELTTPELNPLQLGEGTPSVEDIEYVGELQLPNSRGPEL